MSSIIATKRKVTLIVAGLIILALYLIHSTVKDAARFRAEAEQHLKSAKPGPGELSNNILKDQPAPATGRKLGFEHIYVINAEHREDRKKTMSKLMAFMNIDFELFRATNKTEIDSPERRVFRPGDEKWQQVPPQHHIRSLELACMRSHMNALNDVVIHNYKTALLLEDDVDMEVDIKERLGDLLPTMPAKWDVLYVGHCTRESFDKTEFHPNLFRSRRPSCTHAYAVTLDGAKRLLTLLKEQWPNPKSPYDVTMIDFIKGKKVDSFSVEPPYIIQVRDNVAPGDVAPDTKIPKQWLDRSALYELGLRPYVYELD